VSNLRRFLLVVTVAVAACGRKSVDVARVPEPVKAPQPSAPPTAAPRRDSSTVAIGKQPAGETQDSAAVEADSAADEAALNELDSLQLGSALRDSAARRLNPAAPAVSGAQVVGEAKGMFAAPRGGASSTTAPTYDIDVETFASHSRVQAYVDYFLGPARERFGIWLTRMARYEGMARDRFRAKGIPEDMVYLGLIESGFSNTALSRTKAVGMWQFMPGTARLYGLQMDQWVDERRDPFRATDAAAHLLSDLNGEFGSWYLAAAAYNAGSGRVSRGLRKLQLDSAGSDSMFFRLSDKRYLKRETRDYVPKLIAAALIAKEPGRYGFESVAGLPPLAFDEVSITDQTGLDVIARLADTTTTAIVELNPHLFRAVTPPNRAVIVRVPRGSGTTVAQRWADLPAEERVTVIDHMVARGETIGGIAKRYHVEVSYILAANPKVKSKALRVGQRLVIPVSLGSRANVPAAPRTRARVSRVAAEDAAPAPAPPSGRYHVVRPGESLWQIAQRYHVKINDLREWNDLTPQDVLKPGVRLIVARPGGPSEVAAESVR
jgi:membrane-bound lytic murein transglycosylase D